MVATVLDFDPVTWTGVDLGSFEETGLCNGFSACSF